MIIVTGGSGFLGSNLVRALNNCGNYDIVLVDDLTDGRKIRNLIGLDFIDYVDFDELLPQLESGSLGGKRISAILHQGACSSTTEWDGRYLMKNNFEYSKRLCLWAIENGVQFIYASSASVYGLGKFGFEENPDSEYPLNPYGYSKLMFDNWVRRNCSQVKSQVAGLRYFNVFGRGEEHKDEMASPVMKFYRQMSEKNECAVFNGYGSLSANDLVRDFVSVEDCVKVIIWLFKNKDISGVYNCGTGTSSSFIEIANLTLEWFEREKGAQGRINEIDFPAKLQGSFQAFTKASLTRLRAAGYESNFETLRDGVFRALSNYDAAA